MNIGENAEEAAEQFKQITADLEYIDEDESYKRKFFGLMIYCPENIVENVLIHDEHCFDEENEYLEKMGL